MKYARLVFTLCLVISFFTGHSQNETQFLETKLDSLFQVTMHEQRIPGAAFIIVKDGQTILKKGYGFNSLGEEINYINPDSTIFRIGSITKSFTALSLLQLIERNAIQLKEDINPYLTSFQIPQTFNKHVTSHHLLTHSAGFDEFGGRRVFNENELIPLANFFKTKIKRIREPGEVTAYSTYGIALSGLLVENLSQLTLENYMEKNIWEPLGMHMTSINLPEDHGAIAALGYEMYNNINIPQPWEWYHTFPASSINSTVTDMGKYMQMLLNEGSIGNTKILDKSLVNKMLTQQLSIHPNVDGFTYGLYERKWNGIPAINHGGEMLGYSSFMTLIPEENLGIFVVHHHEGTNLRHLAIQSILDELIETKPINSTTKEKIEGDLTPFVGKYVWLSNCQTCPDSAEQKFWELKVNDDNTLSGFNRIFYQIGSLLFRSTDGERTMGFKKDKKGKIRYMSLGNINIFEKVAVAN
ncbi:serine hydrolase domain-containing protein [uncultured Croceitalea sp.]|uniref:serine hydrolase domain-containing protein n=1 Tax=uncultured Croceitalea sp. TaxID=1798908 RepID=UPI00374E328D